MGILAPKTDERVAAVRFTRTMLVVDLKDGRTISVPLTWYPKLLHATAKQRLEWVICGGGYGIHWPAVDEDLSTEGLLRGSPAPNAQLVKKTRKRKSLSSRSRRRIKPI
jgi:hypothetical protein